MTPTPKITDERSARIERLVASRQPDGQLRLGYAGETGHPVWWPVDAGPLLVSGTDAGRHAATARLIAQATARGWALLEAAEEAMITPAGARSLIILEDAGDLEAGPRVARAHPGTGVVVRTQRPRPGDHAYAARVVHGEVDRTDASWALDRPTFALPEELQAAMATVGDGPVIPLQSGVRGHQFLAGVSERVTP